MFLDELRSQLKDRSFRPLPVRERMIPKPGRRSGAGWGSRPCADRVVQASLKLVLEPIFEADFLPCSYGFRPKRRAHDAIAEIRHFDLPLLRVGGGGRHHSLFGCIVTLLLSLIVLIKIGCLVGLGAGYAGLSGVRCGRGRLGVRRA